MKSSCSVHSSIGEKAGRFDSLDLSRRGDWCGRLALERASLAAASTLPPFPTSLLVWDCIGWLWDYVSRSVCSDFSVLVGLDSDSAFIVDAFLTSGFGARGWVSSVS